MLDILLININYSKDSDPGEGILPPLGLCYISSFLKQKEHKSEVLDANALNLNNEQVIWEIKKYQPLIIGISATTPTIVAAYKTINYIKKYFPKIKIIVGGPHPSVMPEQTLQENKNIDIVVVGEGEITAYETIKAIKNSSNLNDVPGLMYRDQDKIKSTPRRERIADINTLPFPDRSSLPMNKYLPSTKWFYRTPFTTIMTSRGCPNDCIFCASKNILGRAVRFRSPQNVINEIKQLISKYGTKEIIFYDDTFTLNKNHVEKICDTIINEKIDITWGCLSRVDRVDYDLLKKMKRAGCHIISYGIEAGTQKMINNMRKNITIDQIRRAIKITKKAGIDISASFVFGVPGETAQTMKDTIKFATELDPLFAQFYRLVPFPGTDLFELYKKQNPNTTINWTKFLEIGDSNNLIKLDTITTAEFNALFRQCYKAFYWRPKKIILLLYKMSNPYKIKGLLMAVMAFIKLIIINKKSQPDVTSQHS